MIIKKTYVSPEVIDLIAFRTADVITISDYDPDSTRDPFVPDWD